MSKNHCVIIDTNIWRTTLMLRSGLGPALLYAVNRSSGRLGFPEVIEDEVRKHLQIAGEDSVNNIERGFRELAALIGRHRPFAVPSADEIRLAIDTRLDELGPLLERTPITVEATRSALRRVNAGTPPNGPKNQQFKDSMIWEAALHLSERFDTHIVTRDGGFFEGKDFSKPSKHLLDEAEARGGRIFIHPDLQDCLESLRDAVVDVDEGRLAYALKQYLKDALNNDAARRSLGLGDLLSFKVTPFLTERHDVLAFSYELVCDGYDDSAADRSDIVITAEGEGRCSLAQEIILDARLDRVLYSWVDQDGSRVETKSAYLHAGPIYLGREPDVQYSVRSPLR